VGKDKSTNLSVKIIIKSLVVLLMAAMYIYAFFGFGNVEGTFTPLGEILFAFISFLWIFLIGFTIYTMIDDVIKEKRKVSKNKVNKTIKTNKNKATIKNTEKLVTKQERLLVKQEALIKENEIKQRLLERQIRDMKAIKQEKTTIEQVAYFKNFFKYGIFYILAIIFFFLPYVKISGGLGGLFDFAEDIIDMSFSYTNILNLLFEVFNKSSLLILRFLPLIFFSILLFISMILFQSRKLVSVIGFYVFFVFWFILLLLPFLIEIMASNMITLSETDTMLIAIILPLFIAIDINFGIAIFYGFIVIVFWSYHLQLFSYNKKLEALFARLKNYVLFKRYKEELDYFQKLDALYSLKEYNIISEKEYKLLYSKYRKYLNEELSGIEAGR